jgi:hypothetical protein
MAELRITDTNSANDSRGRAFGLEGNDFIYVLVALVFAMGLYVVCTTILRIRVLPAVVLSLPFFVMPAAWVLLLRHNKPAGYAEDWFDHLVNREGWSLVPATQLKASRTSAREHTRT